jgi:hypothetical protein
MMEVVTNFRNRIFEYGFSTRKVLTVCFFASVLVSEAGAYSLNPINRHSATGSDKNRFLDQISEPVHEKITRQARELYLARCLRSPGCEAPQPPKRTIQDSLIRGVWWNDDPNQDLYKGRQTVWIAHMKDAERRANYPKKYTIDGKYMMHYRSHYGDLQFLHSMASVDGEAAAQTKEDIYMWGAFVYQVAAKKVGRDTKFAEVPVNRLLNYFKRQSNWELQWILEPRYRLRDPNDFSDHALGSLLHMVEDSYSAAHVERVYTPTNNCPAGYIKRFHSYSHQDPSKHKKADSMASYRTSHFPAGAGPVDVSAQLIWFARHGADWTTEVVPYLDKMVYCFEGIPDTAGPGEY